LTLCSGSADFSASRLATSSHRRGHTSTDKPHATNGRNADGVTFGCASFSSSTGTSETRAMLFDSAFSYAVAFCGSRSGGSAASVIKGFRS
jgi:hypothetical protein